MTIDTARRHSPVQTTVALVAALLLVIPGLFIGALAVWFYNFSLRWSGVDPQGGLLAWVPFVGAVTNLVFFHLMPEGFRGVVAGAIAIGITIPILKRANFDAVTLAVVSVYAVLGLLLVGLAWFTQGFRMELLDIVANVVGLAIGAFTAKSAINPS